MEMGEWALPAEASETFTNLVNEVKSWPDGERIRRFLQGGMWRNFFAKYPEANWMHKRMLPVSCALSEARSNGRARPELVEGENGAFKRATRHLYKAQCNDAYWHGVFGGLYLPHLRKEIYRNLLAASAVIEKDTSVSVR